MSSVWADVQREGGPVEALSEQVPAQEGRCAAGAREDLQDLGQDLVLQVGQRVRDHRGLLGLASGAADKPGRDEGTRACPVDPPPWLV
jgi:hypothetical protein